MVKADKRITYSRVLSASLAFQKHWQFSIIEGKGDAKSNQVPIHLFMCFMPIGS